MTEKRRPTHDLESFKAASRRLGGINITMTAIRTAAEIGFDILGIVEVIQTMSRRHFVKSMTSLSDDRSWQDVYHVPSEAGVLYVKFTDDRLAAFRLLSFKERDDA